MLKKFFSILFVSILMLGICGSVLAVNDIKMATSTINGVTVNWEYELNESNQIENLKCTNPTDLTGNITLPSTLDGKTVISLEDESFKGANITGLVIPNTLKSIGYRSFSDCENLSSVNLGQLEKISFDVFKNCPKLTSVTIPKTLITGPQDVGGIFTGTTKLTSVTFENGLTEIPHGILRGCTSITKVTIPSSVTIINKCAFQNSGLTEITIPSSVKEIDNNAFQDCENLSNVNLGQLEKISFDVFKNCPKLTSVTIPKTLITGPQDVGGIFTGTTKLTSVTFENGLTEIPHGILRDCTSITKVTIPSSVTIINKCAFQNSGLTEITIPSSVKEIDNSAFQNSGLTEITIPSSVKKIDTDAFKDCDKLEKVTILNEDAKMGSYSIQPTKDSVFENHNENLTIYCYEDSTAAKYAIDNKIKYVYLKKPTTDNDTDKNDEQNQQQKPSDITNTNQDDTTATGMLPQTGATMTGFIIIVIILIVSTIFYIKHRKFRDIK